MTKKERRQKRREANDALYVSPVVSYDYSCSLIGVSIRPSRIIGAGDGLYVLEDVFGGTCIGEYTGERRPLTNMCISSYSFDIQDGSYIDAMDYPRSVIAMVNDSRDLKCGGLLYPYNCEFRVQEVCGVKRCYLYSLIDILAGEELYVDYGPDYWKYR